MKLKDKSVEELLQVMENPLATNDAKWAALADALRAVWGSEWDLDYKEDAEEDEIEPRRSWWSRLIGN